MTEVRRLLPAYGQCEHFYVLNNSAILSSDTQGCTRFITNSPSATGKVIVVDDPDDLARVGEEAMASQKRAQEKRDGAGEISTPPLVSIIERLLSDYADQLSSGHF